MLSKEVAWLASLLVSVVLPLFSFGLGRPSMRLLCRVVSANAMLEQILPTFPEIVASFTQYLPQKFPIVFIFCLKKVMKHPVSLTAMRPWEGPLSCSRGASIYEVRRGVGEGVPKKQMKGTKSADLWQWQIGGCLKIRKFCEHHIWKRPKGKFWEADWMMMTMHENQCASHHRRCRN